MNNVLAVVVTYNRIDNLQKLLEVTTLQVKEVLVIDNGSTTEIVRRLENIVNKYTNVKLIFNSMNVGLATAQNLAVESALQRTDISHILFLDDDSIPSDDMVEELLYGQQEYEEKSGNRVGIIAPVPSTEKKSSSFHYFLRNGNGIAKVKKIDEVIDNVYTVISSGSLIPIATFQTVGLLKESYFIDSIDTEFSLRVFQQELKIVVVPTAILYHSIGESTMHAFMKMRIVTWNHSPIRKYYIIRNRIWMWREYFFKELPYVLFEMQSTLNFVAKIILFEKNKVISLVQVLKGVIHGLFLSYNK